MSGYETYVEGLGVTIPVNRIALECAEILLEYVEGMANPVMSVAQFMRMAGGLSEEWEKRNGDNVIEDILAALHRWETAEAESQERERQAADEASDTHPWNHDTHGERDGLR